MDHNHFAAVYLIICPIKVVQQCDKQLKLVGPIFALFLPYVGLRPVRGQDFHQLATYMYVYLCPSSARPVQRLLKNQETTMAQQNCPNILIS